jgi:hypothetical protein
MEVVFLSFCWGPILKLDEAGIASQQHTHENSLNYNSPSVTFFGSRRPDSLVGSHSHGHRRALSPPARVENSRYALNAERKSTVRHYIGCVANVCSGCGGGMCVGKTALRWHTLRSRGGARLSSRSSKASLLASAAGNLDVKGEKRLRETRWWWRATQKRQNYEAQASHGHIYLGVNENSALGLVA